MRTTKEMMDTEQFICSVFSLPNKCYPRFNKLHKQLLSIGQRFQVTVEKFHKLTQTEETGYLHHIRQTVQKMADTTAVQVAIFGKFHDEISSQNLVTAKDNNYLMPDCVPSRLRRNEWITRSAMCNDTEGKPVANVYMVYVDKNDNLQELALSIQKDIESFGLLSFSNLLLLVGMDPSIQKDGSSVKSFETALADVFQEKKFSSFFMSSTFEDLISSEGDMPKMIQLHLEQKVVQPLQDMLKLIESNTHMYRKNSEETFKGPVAIKESLKNRFSETFLNNQGYLLDVLLIKFSDQHGKMDHNKIAEVIIENLAQVLHCLMVEVLAKMYGIKEYRMHEMLEGMIFKEECRITLNNCIRQNLIVSLSQTYADYDCKSLQIEKERKKFCYLFFNMHSESFWDEVKKNADDGFVKIAYRVHAELEKRVMVIEKNLAIQQKLRFEIETVTSSYVSRQLPSKDGVSSGLKDELLRIELVEGVVVVFGELQVHVKPFPSVQKEKEILKQIDDVMKKHKYWQNYRIGVIEKRPKPFYYVGSTLYCPAIDIHGTLGGFMVDMDNNLYFLTCAHVVPSNADVQVEIRGQRTEPITIGRSVCVQIPTDMLHISADSVDIMAVRVKDDQKPNCIPLFKTADGEFRPGIIVQPFDCSLKEFPAVYKWGAYTDLTHGILHEGHYSKDLFAACNLTDHQYIYVLAETPPVDDDNYVTFALPGDSGAIICAEAENNYIQLVGMIQGGDMHVRTGPAVDKYTLGFYLWCGLDKLLKRSGLNLVTKPILHEELRRQIPQFSTEKHRLVPQFSKENFHQLVQKSFPDRQTDRLIYDEHISAI
ncbi:hypothetical protein CHS0354_027718 [Potamilus streckersoni]|uniref:Uncharacterized protein n=1 Tax=Potamilus streckersoni TaxID=2493646 RepID=A0AAE0SV16_9BIVA|nr:hypothetical protein CHS0354_027718 [Potamilus streckersoni]